MTQTQAPVDWRIESGHVGPAELGKPMPKLVADLGTHYKARLIADGVAVDTFVFDDPPLTFVVEGPFTQATESTADGATEKYRAKAVEAARGGVPLEAVLITAAGPKTAAGIGVGSTFTEVQQAYDDLKLVTLPPTLGNDRCIGTTKQLPGIGFVFETCAKAKAGERVIRIDVRR